MNRDQLLVVGAVALVDRDLALEDDAAVGLLVAIPCVVLNNMLRRRVSELVAQYKVMHGSRA